MHRYVIGLALGAIVASALPAFAGPNGTSYPSFFPLYQQQPRRGAPERPHALLGNVESGETRAIPPGVKGKEPARGWQRRPSEGK